MPDPHSGFAELFDSFDTDAFRLETLDDYGRSGNVDAYQAFLAGKPQAADYNAPWLAKLRTHTAAGRRVHRVHVLTRPLSPYLRFELGWGYRKNMTAGEEFFILDVTERANPLEGVPDFWLFDSTTTAVMNYDEDGAFLAADVLPLDWSGEFCRLRDLALAEAVPFESWWAEFGDPAH
ncbi:DUF6879 family protein [Embleya sp. NPDC050154]|uniref:DUF6879 family protein n=1 Tax=Embleya sp. NPDC050154 TaxID=3363988 RepID=UPI0037A79E73